MLHFETPRRAGFTLIELLTVIAIIGILAAILIPTVSAVRISANKAKTKVEFNQWVAAIESFRSEYGYYPVFDASNLVNPPGQDTDPSTLHIFHDILAGVHRDGTALPAYVPGSDPKAPEAQNRKHIAFYSFSENDFSDESQPTPNLIQDAFDNTQIAVLVDRNMDGVINSDDYGGTLPAVSGMTPTSGGDTTDFPSRGLRAHVVFYAPKPGATIAEPQFIFSWK